MKIFMSLILSICLFFNSCAQQKFEKPPKSDKNKIVDKLPERLYYYINLAELKKNSDSLYCWKIDEKCHIINGKTMLHTYYQTSEDDNPKLIPYTLAEGEFLEGKFPLKNNENRAIPKRIVFSFKDKNGKNYGAMADIDKESAFNAFKEVYGENSGNVTAELDIRVNMVNTFFTVKLKGNGKDIFIKTENLEVF